MAFLECGFHSGMLGKECSMNVVLPQKVPLNPGRGGAGRRRDFKVLYLLHGLSDNHSIWMRRTSVERYATEYDLAVVMPDGGRSFYSDMKHGGKYWSFLSLELPEIVQAMFPVSARREDNFAAGLSMGGYGALKLGLNCPDRFAAVGGISSVCDIPEKFGNQSLSSWHPEFIDIFGSPEEAVADGCDLFTAMKKARSSGAALPRVMQICGTEDFLYSENLRLRDAFRSCDWPEYSYREAPGTHSWAFWDEHIQNILNFMLGK